MVVRSLPVFKAAAVLAAALPLAAQALPPAPLPLILPSLTHPAAATQDIAPGLAEAAAAGLPAGAAAAAATGLPAPAVGTTSLPASGAAPSASATADGGKGRNGGDVGDGGDGGDEYAIEYEVTLREANSLLNRLSTRLKHLVEQAWTFLGTPYRRGGTSRNGLDCSGLVGAVYAGQGLEMPRTAAEQFAQGQPVAEEELRPGDLVFFRGTYKRGISHVGIFVGDGRFIHAAGRRQGVIVSELTRPYFHSRFAGARRLSPLAAATPAGAAALPPGQAGAGLR